MSPRLVPGTIALAALCATFPAAAHDAAPGTEALGKVHFQVSCNAAAQKEFDLAMALFHSFAWEQIKAPLDRASQADPTCGMVHWARALASLDNPFVWPGNVSAATLAEGAALMDKARATGLRTQRERDYVDALAAFFQDADKLNHRTRAKALEAGLEQVAARYPQDSEATILHGLVLSANFDPADKQYGNQLKAAKLLEPVFVKQPDHPGAAHYLIHSYDYPPLAKQGLPAAQRYSKIAPAAAHAQHMPSHIFTRVGAWKDSVAANTMSATSDKASGPNTLHAYDYMVYAHLQMGQDKAAQAVTEKAAAFEKRPDHFAAAYAFAAIPARVALERGNWAAAAKLPLTPAAGGYPWAKYPQAEAANAYARALGAAALRDAPAVAAELGRLEALRARAEELKLGYWVEQIGIQESVVRGFAAFKAGQVDPGLTGLRQAAAREDASEKHVVSPGPLLPAREVLASALLERGDFAGALREFETVLSKEPNRLRAMAGAAVAAERAGDVAKARDYGDKVAQQTAQADVGVAGIQLARESVTR
jgi:tetratricopeptide (TPR) repeat protein